MQRAEIQVSNLRLAHEYGKGYTLTANIETVGVVPALDDLFHTFKDGLASMAISEWHPKRSLTANAYFHVLINKIAIAAKQGEDEVKKMLVLRYGAQMRNDDGTAVGLKLPEGTDPVKLGVKYPKWFDCREEGGRKFDCYLVYGETHTYDSAQMSRLIEGTVSEAKDLKIEVLPPDELKRMLGIWEDTRNDKKQQERT